MILIVDDDPAVLHSLELLLKRSGFRTLGASTPAEARDHLGNADLELVLQDMNFSRKTTGEEGLALLHEIRKIRPDLPVIMITAWGSIELAVQGMKAGAVDFVTKPWQNEQLVSSVRTALNLAASGIGGDASHCPTRDELDEKYDFSNLLGQDPAFLKILDLAGKVAATDASVLITGESGTGKEEVAAAIHRNSSRKDKPYVKVNLGGMSTTLFESEMFGHVKGAFTDAQRDRIGRLSAAHTGTILLDEIGELDPRNQVKLLRVLQDRTYEVLGSSETKQLDLRVISATNRDLNAAILNGSFREDLFYRINLITLHMPSLSERPADIPLLANHFLARAALAFDMDSGATQIAPGALRWLQSQAWPGNVRQLAHFLARAVLIAGDHALDIGICEQVLSMDHAKTETKVLPPVGTMTVDEIEKAVIEKSLRHHDGNLSKAAESLGLSRAALYRRLEKYRILT